MFSTLLAAFLLFHYIQIPVADMHEAPKQDSKVTSQAIFAEEVKVIESLGDWVKIETTLDSFPGWVHKEALCEKGEEYASCSCVKPLVEVDQLTAPIYEKPDLTLIPIMRLPFESRLEAIDPFNEQDPWIQLILPNDMEAYVQRKDVSLDIQMMTKEKMAVFSKRFLDLPSISGGRSSFGYDAAGFIQMLYRQMGWLLPRTIDAQSGWEGFETIPLDELEVGDLLFWGISENRIEHVGMYLGDDEFIHVSMKEVKPQLKISNLNTWPYNGTKEWTFRTGKRMKS